MSVNGTGKIAGRGISSGRLVSVCQVWCTSTSRCVGEESRRDALFRSQPALLFQLPCNILHGVLLAAGGHVACLVFCSFTPRAEAGAPCSREARAGPV